MREVECFFSKKAKNFYFFGKKLLGRIVFVFIFFNFVIEIMLDQITINKFIAGDVKAFERLFRKYARSMQLVALGLYRDTAVAEDAVQESFVYLWNHRKEMKPDIAIEGYLYSCVRHYVLNYIRQQNLSGSGRKKRLCVSRNG